MRTNDKLTAKIETIKGEMQRYRSLPEYLLDGVGAALIYFRRPRDQRTPFLPPSPLNGRGVELPSYWFSGAIVALVTILIGWLVSVVRGEQVTGQDISVSLWAAAVGALALIANKVNIRIFLETFYESILGKMQSLDDLDDFGQWLNRNFEWFWPLVAGILGGPVLAFVLIYNLGLTDPTPLNTGTTVVVIMACVQSIWVAYYLFPFYVALPSQLAGYRFDLYTTDPSSSEVVGRLSRLMTFIMYVTLGYIVQLTIGLNQLKVLNLSTAFVFSLLVWLPTIVLYAAGQFHISSVISRAKWRTLNEIQAKIETLYDESLDPKTELPKKETLEIIEKLMDSHDRIKSTPNSALNFRSGLNFLNSLLLPVLAFVIANLESVTNFIQGRLGKLP